MAIYSWRVGNGDFGLPADWSLNGQTSLTGPAGADTATFTGQGGTVTGTGTVDRISVLAAINPWVLLGTFTATDLTDTTGFVLTPGSTLKLNGRPNGGNTGPAFSGTLSGVVAVNASTFDSSGGTLNVGSVLNTGATSGTLVIQNGGVVTVLGVIAGQGSTGVINVMGASSILKAVTAPNLSTGFIDIGTTATVGGNPVNGQGQLVVSSGATVQADGRFFVAPDAGSGGNASFTGGSSLTVKNGTAISQNGMGTMSVSGGSVVTTATSGATAVDGSTNNDFVGSNTGGTGTLTLDGAGTKWNSGNQFIVANGGTGTATISNGAALSVVAATAVGQLAGSIGILNLSSGGTASLGGTITVGNTSGSNGTINIGPGSVLRGALAAQSTNYTLAIGLNAATTGQAAAVGVVNVTGAGALLDMGGNSASVGQSGTGTLAVSAGGTAKFAAVNPGFSNTTEGLAIGRVGTGLVTVDGAGSSLQIAGSFYTGRSLGSLGTLRLTNSASFTESLVNASDANAVGSYGPNGTTVTGGTGVFTVASGSTAVLGNQLLIGTNGAIGTATITASGSKVSDGGAVYVGGGGSTGVTTAGSGTLSIAAGGVLQVTAASDTSKSYLQIGNSTNSRGAATVDGAGSLLDITGNSASIGNGGNGSLTVSGGAAARSGSGDSRVRSALSLGNATGSAGTMLVSGMGSKYTAAGYVYVGRGGSAFLTVDQLGSFTGGAAATGDGTGGNAFFAVTIGDGTPRLDVNGVPNESIYYQGAGLASVMNEGQFHSLSDLDVGDRGGTGVLSIDTGSTVLADRLILVGNGTDRAGANGSILVQGGGWLRAGGQHILASAGIGLGVQAGTSGIITVAGAGSVLDANGDRITVGARASGSLTVSGGARALSGSSYADVEAAFAVGAAAGAVGTVQVTGSGSQLLASGLGVLGGDNTGAGVIGGGTGTLRVTSGGLVRVANLASFAGSTLTIDGTGTGVVGTSTGTVGRLTVDAGAGISGAGTIHATVLNNGTVVANGGTLYLDAITGSGAGTLNAIGGSLEIGVSGAASYGFSGIGTIRLHSVSGASTVSGFAIGDTLDFADTSAVSLAGNVATVTMGGVAVATYTAAVAPGTALALSADGSGGMVLTVAAAKPLDFNGDGRSDLLLQNDNGAIVIETTNGLNVGGGGLISSPSPTYHVVGAADFNGDGQNDILLQNDNGAIVDFLMNGLTITAGNLLTNPGPTWHVRGTGDFNHDGKADMVLQNDNGYILVEYTDGTNVIGGAFVSNPGPSWTVEGVADFNGDGQPDILLQNTNGTIVDFLLNGTTVAAGYQLLGPNVGYSVAGTGNYNGDNRADLLLHNDNGTDVVLYTNGQAVIGSAAPIGNPGPTWATAIGGVDYNGDGSSDLLIENTAGVLVGYTLNSSGVVTSSNTITNPGPGWRALGGPPMQFIDGTGTAPTLAGTPGVDEFNFTSFTPGIHTITNFDAAIDLIALSAAAIGSYANLQAHEFLYNGGTAIGLSANAAIVIQGVTPDQLSSANFVLR